MAETAISVYSHMTGEMECNAAKKMDDALGRVTRYFYDQKKGHLLAVISPDGNGTSYTYDALGRMTLAVPAKVNSSGTGYTSVTGSAKQQRSALVCSDRAFQCSICPSRRCFCCAGHGSEKMKQAEFRAQR